MHVVHPGWRFAAASCQEDKVARACVAFVGRLGSHLDSDWSACQILNPLSQPTIEGALNALTHSLTPLFRIHILATYAGRLVLWPCFQPTHNVGTESRSTYDTLCTTVTAPHSLDHRRRNHAQSSHHCHSSCGSRIVWPHHLLKPFLPASKPPPFSWCSSVVDP